MSGIKETPLQSYEQLESEISKLRETHFKRDGRGSLLFRGQSDARWPLQTTLERSLAPQGLIGYLKNVAEIQFEIEAVTGRKWPPIDLTSASKTASDFNEIDKALTQESQLPYDYLIFLRHHGFPSPLLDWTRSPHVALFFAFRQHTLSDRVALYALSQHKIQTYASNDPKVYRIGPLLRTDRRHFIQQSEYTICTLHNNDCGTVFAKHDAGFASNVSNTNYTITKFVLPASQRSQALAALQDYNLHAYSLFGSEDALMETLATRVYAVL